LLSSDNTATLTRWCKFGNIHRDLGGADSDGQAVDEATDNEHGNVLGRTDDYRADAPDNGADLGIVLVFSNR
jgi:hypothetical protein